MCHDWPVKNAIVTLPIRMRENLKRSSGQNKDLGAASQTLLTEVGYHFSDLGSSEN